MENVILQDAPNPDAGFQYAGFWIRLCALFIDTAIIWPLIFLIKKTGYDVSTNTVVYIMASLISPVIMGVIISGSWQASPGKRLMKIFIVDNGKKITFLRAFIRTYMYMAVALVVMLAFGVLPIVRMQDVAGTIKPSFDGWMTYSGCIFIIDLIWYLPIVFTKQKTALHDIILGTRVLKSRAEEYYKTN